MIEAFNFAAAKETYLTDPSFDNKVDQVPTSSFYSTACFLGHETLLHAVSGSLGV